MQQPAMVAASAMAEVCRGLHSVHELRDRSGRHLEVVHRDINPKNLLLTFDGRIKAIDFGVAHFRSRKTPHTQIGLIKGTPTYHAPEQAQGSTIDRRSDVFACGIVLFELLTGRQLLGDVWPTHILDGLARGSPAIPSAFVSEISADLDAVVSKALQEDPAQRFQTAEDMAASLQRIVGESDSKQTLAEFVQCELKSERQEHEQRLQALLVGEPGNERRPTAVSSQNQQPPEARAMKVFGPLRWVWWVLVSIVAVVGFGTWWVHQDSSTAVSSKPSRVQPKEMVKVSVPANPDPQNTNDVSLKSNVAPRTREKKKASRKPAAKSSRQRPEPKVAEVPVGPDGFLTLQATPYAEVRIDGKAVGPTPIFEHALSPGTHRVEFVSPEGKVRERRTVTIRPAKKMTLIIP
ncbi:MAG: serine/threonine-protein kinase [Myxococcota bacterium]